MPAFVRISLLLLFTSVWTAPARAQDGGLRPPGGSAAPTAPHQTEPVRAATDAEDLRISLLTILPGSDIHSLWGHSAIRVVNPQKGTDLSFNYGTFDFETSFFVLKFMHGNLDYRLSVHDFEQARRYYRAQGRPVIEQVLRISPEQRAQLVRFLEVNLLPENRHYRYHFLFDNCSTRVRDAVERALDESVRFADEPDPELSFRQLIDPYQREVPFLDAGIDWLLGSPVDRTAYPYETMFLPDYLMQAFAHASVEADGRRQPLVVSTDTLFWIEGYDPARSRFAWEAVFMWVLFGAVLIASIRRPDVLRAVDAPLFIVVGLAGLLIAYLWFISHHDVTEANWHLLWAWPLHLIAGVALLRRRSGYPRWIGRYMLIAAVLACAAIASAPLWPQAFNPVLIPIALAVALRGAAIFTAGRKRVHAATAAEV